MSTSDDESVADGQNSSVGPETSEIGSRKGEKKKNYPIKRKLEIIEYAKNNSNKAAADKFKVARTSVIDWRKQETKIREKLNDSTTSLVMKRLPGAGRKLSSQELDDALIDWIKDKRNRKQRVSRRLIQLKALEIAGELEIDDETFSASTGWLAKFMERHSLSLRRTTTTCQKPPSDYIPKLVSFVIFIRKQRKEKQYPYNSIYACDETAVWLDPQGARCVTNKGAKDVTVQSTGHEKLHVTVMLCAKANGSKCLPYVFVPRKRPNPDILRLFSSKLIISWAGTVWMNDALTVDFLNKVIGRLSFSSRLLVWDAFRCHISETVKTELRKLKLDTAVVPGGCTKFVQAPDVCWNKPFKEKINQYYEDWLLNGEKSFTPAGNMRPPPMEVYMNWIVNAWDGLSADLISNSFKACGVSNAVDGSEDCMIHCFKADGPCGSEGLQLLNEEAKKFNAEGEIVIELDEEEDSEENDENGYASDASVELTTNLIRVS